MNANNTQESLSLDALDKLINSNSNNETITKKSESEETNNNEQNTFKTDNNNEVKKEENNKTSEENNKEDIDTESEIVEISYNDILKDFIEKGVIDSDIIEENAIEETNIDDKSFSEIIDKQTEKKAEILLERYIENLPEEARDIMFFIQSGGNIRSYLKTVSVTDNIDELLNSKEGQSHLVKNHYRNTMKHLPEDALENIIKGLSEKQIEDISVQIVTDIKTQENFKKQEIIQKENEQRIRQQEESKRFLDNIIKELNSLEIAGSRLNLSEKKDLEDFTLKVNQNGQTNFQSKLNSILMDPQSSLKLAYFINNGMDNSDKLIKKAEKKVIAKLSNATTKIEKNQQPNNKKQESNNIDLSFLKKY